MIQLWMTKNKIRKDNTSGRVWLSLLVVLVLFLVGLFFYHLVFGQNDSYEIPVYSSPAMVLQEEIISPPKKHLPTPEAVKAIYITSCAVATPSFLERLINLVEETEINSVVIDVKDYTGTLSYPPKDESLYHMWESARCGTREMENILADLYDREIYTIARVTVFQDPHLVKRRPDLAVKFASTGEPWKDHKGLNFTDVGAKEVWDYHIKIAKDAYELGFDEINFDYIRFPSDGPMRDISFPFSGNRPKPVVLEEFFEYLYNELKDTGMITSADLFGMTTTNIDDLNIGQVWERALPYFDYLAPMIYPSHYPKNFNNWADPNKVPYDIIKFALDAAVRRTVATTTTVTTNNGQAISTTTPIIYTKESYDKNKVRPWLQDFNYPVPYTPEMVRAQIQATYDAGLNSWMMWDPANRYTRSVYNDR